MELRHLRYFVAVGEALSFTKAASRLHLSQPSLTRQVRDLELEIDVKLLDRTKQQIVLTAEGRAFLVDAKRVVGLSAEIVKSVQRLSRHENAALQIGYVANLFYDILPGVLTSFQASFPTIPVNLFDMSCGDQIRALEDGRLDLGFIGLCRPTEPTELEVHTVATYRALAALPKDHPLTNAEVVKLKELKSMFFIGISETSFPGYHRWITQTCRQAGFKPKILQDAEIERAAVDSVAAGLGVTILPDPVRKFAHHDVVFRPIAPAIKMKAGVAWKRGNSSPGLRGYIEIVKSLSTSMR